MCFLSYQGTTPSIDFEELVIKEVMLRIPKYSLKEALVVSHTVKGRANSKLRKTLNKVSSILYYIHKYFVKIMLLY